MEESDQLSVREQRLVYLVTYSRADLEKVPTRKAFAEAVKEAWLKTTGVRVTQWVKFQYLSLSYGSEDRETNTMVDCTQFSG